MQESLLGGYSMYHALYNDQLCERLHQCLSVQAEAQHLGEGVKDETEVSDSCYSRKSLFVHVTSFLYEAPPNVVVRQTGPQPAHLRSRRMVISRPYLYHVMVFSRPKTPEVFLRKHTCRSTGHSCGSYNLVLITVSRLSLITCTACNRADEHQQSNQRNAACA